MSTPQDPEQLLAQALRAQAARAPHDERRQGSGEHEAESAALAAEPGDVPVPPGWPGGNAPAEPARADTTDTAESAPAESAELAYPPDDAATGIAPGTPSGYGLLSGTGASSLEAERAALERTTPAPSEPASQPAPRGARRPGDAGGDTSAAKATGAPVPPGPPEPSGPLPARWVLLLAVLLGLAAGSVVGMLTLL